MKKEILLLLFVVIQGIAKTQIPIENISYHEDSYSDLAFLEKELEGKKIVCLGEEWHFTETFNQVKNRIVKYLHKELGYNVILFESSFHGALIAESENLEGKGRLFETVQTIWRTESVLDLMKYISKTKKGSTPMSQYGVDLYGTYTDRFNAKLSSFLASDYPDLKDEILAVDSKIQEDYLAKHRNKRKFKTQVSSEEIERYKSLLSAIKADINTLNHENNSTLLREIENRILLGESLLSKDLYFREKAMAENIEWILAQLSEEDKVIIWAADINISKSQKTTVPGGDKSMIERLPDSIKDSVYSLSLIPIKSAPKKVKKKLNKHEKRFFFYNLKEARNPINRGDEFDGMIICKDVEGIEGYKVL